MGAALLPPPGADVLSVYGLVVRIHNAVIAGAGVGITALLLGSRILVELLGHGVEGLLNLLGGFLDGSHIGALVHFLQLVNRCLDVGLFLSGDLVAQLAQGLFRLVSHLVGSVVGVHFFLPGLILGGVLLSLPDSLVDVLLAQVGGSGNGNLLLLAGAQVLGGYLHNAVGIDVEGNLNLGHATGSGGNAGQLE